MSVSPAMDNAAPASARVVGWRFILLYAFGYTGTWLALLTPGLVSLALRLRQLSPATAKQDLALVLSVGAVFAIVSNPIFGHLSDRTRSRFGRRRPWLVGGMLCGTAALLIIARAESVTFVLVGWCLAQLAFNAVLAAMVAVLPDQVPEAQRGTVSGVIAICLPLGQALGTLIVRGVSDSTMLIFLLPAALGTMAVLLLAWMLPDRVSVRAATGSPTLKDSLRAFWLDPRAYPDFAWACLSRFLLAMGGALITAYQPYYLIENLGFADAEVAGRVSQAVVVQTLVMVVFGLISGKLSDLIRRRKVFVIAGGVLYAAGLWLIASAGSYAAFVAGMAIMGMGHGMYFGTDLALVTGVLRSRPHASGNDLGLLNVANTLPQSFTAALGSLILQSSGGNYTLLFMLAGCSALLSSVAILPLRSVR
ncbi:MAG TPA: MFS transporter [Steroidobacteraceae bacterium]|nr:MFS transporter [Steroidobacteraceae bacterium]